MGLILNIRARALKLASTLSCAWVALICASTAQAQTAPVINCQGRPVTALTFSNPTLVSGSALQTGAVYRFSNIATGVDSLVQITGFVNGGNLSTIDRDTGLVNYFQPELLTSASGTGAADFLISFVQAGTTTPINLDIAASSIDVDGNNVNLREYVEYDDASSGYVLNATTRLDRNVSGPTPGSNRYESRTSQVAPGIDPTAEDNIVTVFYTDVSSFTFRVGTLGSGNMTRLTSQGYDCPNLSSPFITPEVNEDYGDALLNNYGNPIHTIVPGIQLGTSNTTETASYNNGSASGDAGDDGVSSMPNFVRGQTVNIPVNVSGSGGYLQAWFDFNNDGDFLDPGEQIATDVQDGNNNGLITLNVPTPLSASQGNKIIRFRWSTTSGIGYQEAVDDGEVEDYQVSVFDPPVAPLSCPVGYTVSAGSGNAGTVVVDAINGTRALGAIAANGTNATGVSARIRNTNPTLVLQLEHLVPENANVTVSIARDNNGSNVDIEGSLDGITFFPIGTFNGGNLDTLNHLTLTASTGGMEFVRVQRNGGATWIDGIEYFDICTPSASLQGQKDVTIYDPTNIGLYMLPGNDVIYTLTATNTGGGPVDVDTVMFIDRLPPEIEIWNGDIDDGGPETAPVSFSQTAGTGFSFNYSTDVRFGTGPTKPADFASCSVITPDSTYRPDLTYICFNPKGAMASGSPDPEFSLSFRSRIK